MANKKLFDLPELIPADTVVDMIFKEKNQQSSSSLNVSSLFNWIKQEAIKDDGITVECLSNDIIFIKGRKL